MSYLKNHLKNKPVETVPVATRALIQETINPTEPQSSNERSVHEPLLSPVEYAELFKEGIAPIATPAKTITESTKEFSPEEQALLNQLNSTKHVSAEDKLHLEVMRITDKVDELHERLDDALGLNDLDDLAEAVEDNKQKRLAECLASIEENLGVSSITPEEQQKKDFDKAMRLASMANERMKKRKLKYGNDEEYFQKLEQLSKEASNTLAAEKKLTGKVNHDFIRQLAKKERLFASNPDTESAEEFYVMRRMFMKKLGATPTISGVQALLKRDNKASKVKYNESLHESAMALLNGKSLKRLISEIDLSQGRESHLTETILRPAIQLANDIRQEEINERNVPRLGKTMGILDFHTNRLSK
jgi:hypothetical protein